MINVIHSGNALSRGVDCVQALLGTEYHRAEHGSTNPCLLPSHLFHHEPRMLVTNSPFSRHQKGMGSKYGIWGPAMLSGALPACLEQLLS